MKSKSKPSHQQHSVPREVTIIKKTQHKDFLSKQVSQKSLSKFPQIMRSTQNFDRRVVKQQLAETQMTKLKRSYDFKLQKTHAQPFRKPLEISEKTILSKDASK